MDNRAFYRFSLTLIVCWAMGILNAQAQTLEVGGRNILHPGSHTLTQGDYKGEQVDYVLIGDVEPSKPLVVFCNGSMPTPLLLNIGGGKHAPIALPFSCYGFLAEYNFLVFSKPGVPVATEQTALDPQFNYLDPKTKAFPTYFSERNHQDYYEEAYSETLNAWLAENEDQSPAQLILIGHSQGARVVSKMVAHIPQTTHLVYLSADPMGRFYEIIRRESEGATTEEINEAYDSWAAILKQPDAQKDSYTFSEYLIDDLLEVEIPLFVGYGTRDVACETCGLIYFEAIRKGKTNVHHAPYPKVDHNFFPLTAEGRPDQEKGKWDQVAKDIIEWSKATPPQK